MRALELPVLFGVVGFGWSRQMASAVQKFCKANGSPQLLLRIDKRDSRWTKRRGGYIIEVSEAPLVTEELAGEDTLAILLEPASPYADQYSMTGVTLPDEQKIIVEVVGPGFDASDILRSDISAHERWEVGLPRYSHAGKANALSSRRVYLIEPHQYEESVKLRLAKIGARSRNPAFPDSVLKDAKHNVGELADDGIAYLRKLHQTTLLKHRYHYEPIPERHLSKFAGFILKLLSGLAEYGIHLGSTSFAASVIPKRGLVFWDFFPARKQDVTALYPAA